MKVLCIEESTSIILIIVLPRFSKLEISTDNLGYLLEDSTQR